MNFINYLQNKKASPFEQIFGWKCSFALRFNFTNIYRQNISFKNFFLKCSFALMLNCANIHGKILVPLHKFSLEMFICSY